MANVSGVGVACCYAGRFVSGFLNFMDAMLNNCGGPPGADVIYCSTGDLCTCCLQRFLSYPSVVFGNGLSVLIVCGALTLMLFVYT